jgi:hypothetical protein
MGGKMGWKQVSDCLTKQRLEFTSPSPKKTYHKKLKMTNV